MQTIVRTDDEAVAHAEAKAQDDGKQAMKQEVRSLKQAAKVAKEIGAKGQVFLFEKEIKRVGRAYRIRHENPYPEVTKADAMNAMCEPIPQKAEAEMRLQSGLSDRMFDALKQAYNGVTASEFNQVRQAQSTNMQASLSNMMDAYYSPKMLQNLGASLYSPGLLGQLQSQPGAVIQVRDPLNDFHSYNRNTHKYDLACAPLFVEGMKVQNSTIEGGMDYQAMLPMSALCRLKEAKDKDIFDSFEVWRPAEWKAPDPWLVGVHMDQGKAVYSKVCDWR